MIVANTLIQGASLGFLMPSLVYLGLHWLMGRRARG
jgi:hypothetical protein